MAALLTAVLGCALHAGAPADEAIVASFGGASSGDGAAVVLNGIWKFDLLAPDQLAENCEATALDPFGHAVVTGGWIPARESLVEPRIEPLDPTWIIGPASGDVGGGIMSFYDERTGGFIISHFSVMESPIVSVPSLGLDFSDGPLALDFTFASNSDPVPLFLRFIVGSRVLVGPSWSSWIDSDLTIFAGPQDYRVPLAHLIGPGIDAIQFRIGVYNQLDSFTDGGGIAAAQTKGPAVDKAKVDAKKPPAGYEFERLVPDISQEKKAICIAAAFANVMSYWANNGFPQLLEGGATQAEKNLKIRDALAKLCHSADIVAGGQDMGTAGAQEYLKTHNATSTTAGMGNPYLTYGGKTGAGATWTWLKDNFNQNSLAVINITHAKADGTLLKPDQKHYLTVARIEEKPDGKKFLYCANPWGEHHHAVTQQNKKDAYHRLDVTVLPDGRIRLDDEDLEKNTAGFEDVVAMVDHLRVISIYTIRRFPLLPPPPAPSTTGSGSVGPMSLVMRSGDKRDGSGARAVTSPSSGGVSGGEDTYALTVVNDLDQPLRFFALQLAVPYDNVQSPRGWSWQPLPANPIGLPECSELVGDNGIAWTADRDDAAIPPGGSLDGFGYDVAAGTPFSNDGPVTLAQDDDELLFGVTSGPVSPCIADLDHNGIVNGFDLAMLLGDWGPCAAATTCPADLNGDEIVGALDLAILLAAWGPCR
jgi:hypothetical protein